MGYNIYLINERKKEFVRTKTNGEDCDFIIGFLIANKGEVLSIEGESSEAVEDLLSEKGRDYKEIDLWDYW